MEPWVVIPAMAAVTQRRRFYTHVLKLPIRHPLLVAKTIASAAVLSGERILLGVGTSWIPEEAAWCGTDFRTRGKRTDEAIEIIRLCLGGGMVSWQGEHYQFGPLEMAPVPSAPVPIIVGGHSRAALRRAARLGDGWCSANLTTAEVAPLVQQVRALREEAGRAEEPFEIQALCTDAFDADGFRRMRDIGVTDAIVWPWPLFGGNPAELEDKLDSLARFAETIIEPLRAEG
jgi:probable F420-dependent oxidoreductase